MCYGSREYEYVPRWWRGSLWWRSTVTPTPRMFTPIMYYNWVSPTITPQLSERGLRWCDMVPSEYFRAWYFEQKCRICSAKSGLQVFSAVQTRELSRAAERSSELSSDWIELYSGSQQNRFALMDTK